MKKFILLLAALLVLAACGGCGKDYNRKLMLVTQSPTFNDNGYNYGLWQSLEHYGLQTKVVTMANPDRKPLLDVMTKAVKEKPGLLFISSDENTNPELEPLVAKYPEITFVMLDKKPSFTGKNYTTVWVKSNEGAFLAGYLAALMTQSGKVGFIGGTEADTIARFKYGYLAGVAYANQQQLLSVETQTLTAGTFTDQAVGEKLARQMYKDGCDIIFAAAGKTGLGSIAAAVQENKYVIGVDVDQQELAPENMLCSVLSDYNVIIKNIVSRYLKQEKSLEVKNTGLVSGAAGVVLNHRLVPYNQAQRIRQLREVIKNGFEVPDSKDSYEQFIAGLQTH